MLNEIEEYNEYTTKDIFEKNKKASPRLVPNVFVQKSGKERFIGLERVLEIIARYELFEKSNYGSLSKKMEKLDAIKNTKDSLEKWFGGWLKKYYEEYIKTDKLPEEWWEKVSGAKMSQFKNELFPINKEEIEQGRKNTARDLTYEKIISNALIKGPLTEYVLVLKDGWYAEIYKDSDKLVAEGVSDSEIGTRTRNDLNHILRGISAYLLAKEYDKKCTEINNRYQVVRKVDLANWDQTSDIYKNGGAFFDKYCFQINNKYVPMFLRAEGFSGYSKMCVNEEFMKEYRVRIVPKNELEQIINSEENLVCYEDLGSMFPLKKYMNK